MHITVTQCWHNTYSTSYMSWAGKITAPKLSKWPLHITAGKAHNILSCYDERRHNVILSACTLAWMCTFKNPSPPPNLLHKIQVDSWHCIFHTMNSLQMCSLEIKYTHCWVVEYKTTENSSTVTSHFADFKVWTKRDTTVLNKMM